MTLSESLIIALVVLLLCGASLFYMYVRVMFLEKKVNILESILVDVRVALDSIMMEHSHQPSPIPISHTLGAGVSVPAPVNAGESDTIPEEKFYSSVLQQAHEKAQPEDGVSADKALESFQDVSGEVTLPEQVAQPSVGLNLDSMTRQELANLAEKKGLRVKRNMNRGEVLALLRRTDATQNDPSSTGTENVSGSTGPNNQAGSSLDGNASVDLGRNGASLEESM